MILNKLFFSSLLHHLYQANTFPELLKFGKRVLALLPIALCLLALACTPPKRVGGPVRPNQPGRPTDRKPQSPMDTIRWTPGNPKPPIKNNPTRPGEQPTYRPGDTYHLAFLLPFLTNQASGSTVPEKSRLAVQFYAGAKIALEQLSREGNINLVADVYDTQAEDADFQRLMTNSRLEKAQVFIGPVRASHITSFAAWAKVRRKIVVSPESPSTGLTTQNPDFIQINPSLPAHCATITQYIRQQNQPDAVTLVCKEKEADRLAYFQQANLVAGGTRFAELVVPDATTSFEKFDLRKYLRPGRTAVFVMPSWASQDFVMAFLRNLKAIKGSNRVEVYGMPQWQGFEAIEPEYLTALNVHISAAAYLDYSAPAIKTFQQSFYEATGTLPEEDGFNGYDVTMFTGKMLMQYGLSFPGRLQGQIFRGLRGDLRFAPVYTTTVPDDRTNQYDYLENTFVHILKFDKYGFVPVEN